MVSSAGRDKATPILPPGRDKVTSILEQETWIIIIWILKFSSTKMILNAGIRNHYPAGMSEVCCFICNDLLFIGDLEGPQFLLQIWELALILYFKSHPAVVWKNSQTLETITHF